MKPVSIRVSKFGSVRRYDGNGKTIKNGGTRVHRARDVYFPSGSGIFTPPWPAKLERWSVSNGPNKDGSPNLRAGRIANLDTRGHLLRLVHVESAELQLKAGQLLAGNVRVGLTRVTKFDGGSASHLHVDARPTGGGLDDRIDPLEWMGWDALLALGGYMLAQPAPVITGAEFRVLAVPLVEAPLIESA